MKPIVEEHDGVLVVRDDLYPGGTKARYIAGLFEKAAEIVYASPAEGGAQTALAHCAKAAGKLATIFVANRKEPHPRQVLAKALGAKVVLISPGYLSVVQARARAYCEATGAMLAPFGMHVDGSTEAIRDAALATGIKPDEVWCASGSGVLARGLAAAFPKARRFSVEVGRKLSADDVAGAKIVPAGVPFERAERSPIPFPSDPHYDAKAWLACQKGHGRGVVLFWNVAGAA